MATDDMENEDVLREARKWVVERRERALAKGFAIEGLTDEEVILRAVDRELIHPFEVHEATGLPYDRIRNAARQLFEHKVLVGHVCSCGQVGTFNRPLVALSAA